MRYFCLLGLCLGLGLGCHNNLPVRGPDAATRCERRPAVGEGIVSP